MIEEKTGVTNEAPLKILTRLADQIQHGDPSLKAARGFYLRKMFKAFNTRAVYAEHGSKT